MVYERQAIVISRSNWRGIATFMVSYGSYLDVRLAVGRQATISSTLEGNQPKHGHHIYRKFLPPYY